MQKDTIEIDPEELSKDVRENLEKEIGEDVAERKAKEIRLNSMNNGIPNKKSSIETIRGELDNKINKIDMKTEKKYVFGEINDIEPSRDDEEIQFTISRNDKNEDDVITMDKDSTELANLVEYKNLDNVLELEGEKIPYRDYGFSRKKEKYLIPNNLSYISQFRYKIHNKLTKIKNIIDIFTENKHFDTLIFGSMSLTGLCAFMIPISYIPVMIVGTIGFSTFFILILYIITDILLNIADGDFYRIESESNCDKYW